MKTKILIKPKQHVSQRTKYMDVEEDFNPLSWNDCEKEGAIGTTRIILVQISNAIEIRP